jgi:hypothetical protein
MQGTSQLKGFLFGLALLLPVYASAANVYTSELSNHSKTEKSAGYYLVQDKVWSENGCVADSGKEKLNPGDMTTLKIKKDCKWGGVRYKIHQVKGDATKGYLAHSFHDGTFTIEITENCNNNNCEFRDLSPEQDR